MEQMKQILFEETRYYCDSWIRLQQELGEFDRLTCMQCAKFNALYTVIEDSGLAEEYRAWKQKQ